MLLNLLCVMIQLFLTDDSKNTAPPLWQGCAFSYSLFENIKKGQQSRLKRLLLKTNRVCTKMPAPRHGFFLFRESNAEISLEKEILCKADKIEAKKSGDFSVLPS